MSSGVTARFSSARAPGDRHAPARRAVPIRLAAASSIVHILLKLRFRRQRPPAFHGEGARASMYSLGSGLGSGLRGSMPGRVAAL